MSTPSGSELPSMQPPQSHPVRPRLVTGLLIFVMAALGQLGLMHNPAVAKVPTDTIHVRVEGDDSTGDGTRKTPFATISAAFMFAQDGVVILVGPGTFGGTIEYPCSTSIMLVSESGPFVTHLIGDGQSSVVVMDLCDSIWTAGIEGFTIRDNNTLNGEKCIYCPGGIYVGGLTRANISNCIIRNNMGSPAGGIEYSGRNGVIANNWIIANTADTGATYSGGLELSGGNDVTVVGNTIVGNHGEAVGGVQLNNTSNINRHDNNIIAFNGPGPGISAANPLAGKTLYNNLEYGNGAPMSGIPLTQGWVLADPLFVDSASADYHLTCPSPARLSGRTTSVPAGLPRDIDGQLRVTGDGQVDIGADQFYDADKLAAFVPSVDFGCPPLNVTFNNISMCVDEGWLWSFGDNTTSTLKNPFHQYQSPGIYEVRLIAIGDLDSDTTFDSITVFEPIKAEFTANVISGCVPLLVDFTANINSPAGSYSWDFGDGDSDTGQTVSHKYTAPGSHTVTLTASNDCGVDVETKTGLILVKTRPEVQFVSSFDDATKPTCNPFTVEFAYTSDRPISAWHWDFGDNGASTDSNPSHTYVDGDTFSVRLIAVGECGSDTVVRNNYIRLVPRPRATPTASPQFACAGSTRINFQALAVGQYTSARWFFGDGTSAPGTTTSHTYLLQGRYLPRVVINSTCGSDTFAVADSITVGLLPEAAFTQMADSGYEPLTVQFTDGSTNFPTQWLWRFGEVDSSLQQNPTHVFAAGRYQTFMVASNPCGADTSDSQGVVVGTFRAQVFDSLGSSGDTISYSVQVDTSILLYDNPVYLSARLTPFPVRGSMNFMFAPSVGAPPYEAIMRAIPSPDLATGQYAIELRAVDSARVNAQGQPVTKTDTQPVNHLGRTVVRIDPSPLVMDSTPVAIGLSTRPLIVRNTSGAQQPITLNVQPPTVSGPPFEIVEGSAVTLGPGQQVIWIIGFRPTRKGDFQGLVRVRSDDPGRPDVPVTVTGRGIGEQTPPKVQTAFPPFGSEALIDRTVSLGFSEQVVRIPLDTVFTVDARRQGPSLTGQLNLTSTELTFDPDGWWWPDDTITVRLRAIVTDTNGNRLDGDGDGNEEGSPADDYVITFTTGPGVYPGDANRDGRVNEADILPLGRYWGMSGPARPQQYSSYTMQPAWAYTQRNATHADADGSGEVDSADICPIAEFFDRDTALPKQVVQQWLDGAESWSSGIVDAMLGALLVCPNQTAGTQILGEVLRAMQGTTPVPAEYSLLQNYPNPFNPSTVIPFSLGADGNVRLEVYDILGRRMATLLDGPKAAGHHHVVWDGRNDHGDEMASGVYFYRLQSAGLSRTRKMLLLK